jgi:hypothetical protein
VPECRKRREIIFDFILVGRIFYMKAVGEHLRVHSVKQTDSNLMDLFGRSAFNRFYYAAFLITRDMLGDLDPKWKKLKHSTLPVILEKSLKPIVLRRVNKNVQSGIMSEGEKSKQLRILKVATGELSNLLKEAYALRCIADYQPELRVSRNRDVLTLEDKKLTTAKTWPDKSSACCKSIRKVFMETGIV